MPGMAPVLDVPGPMFNFETISTDVPLIRRCREQPPHDKCDTIPAWAATLLPRSFSSCCTQQLLSRSRPKEKCQDYRPHNSPRDPSCLWMCRLPLQDSLIEHRAPSGLAVPAPDSAVSDFRTSASRSAPATSAEVIQATGSIYDIAD